MSQFSGPPWHNVATSARDVCSLHSPSIAFQLGLLGETFFGGNFGPVDVSLFESLRFLLIFFGGEKGGGCFVNNKYLLYTGDE